MADTNEKIGALYVELTLDRTKYDTELRNLQNQFTTSATNIQNSFKTMDKSNYDDFNRTTTDMKRFVNDWEIATVASSVNVNKSFDTMGKSISSKYKSSVADLVANSTLIGSSIITMSKGSSAALDESISKVSQLSKVGLSEVGATVAGIAPLLVNTGKQVEAGLAVPLANAEKNVSNFEKAAVSAGKAGGEFATGTATGLGLAATNAEKLNAATTATQKGMSATKEVAEGTAVATGAAAGAVASMSIKISESTGKATETVTTATEAVKSQEETVSRLTDRYLRFYQQDKNLGEEQARRKATEAAKLEDFTRRATDAQADAFEAARKAGKSVSDAIDAAMSSASKAADQAAKTVQDDGKKMQDAMKNAFGLGPKGTAGLDKYIKETYGPNWSEQTIEITKKQMDAFRKLDQPSLFQTLKEEIKTLPETFGKAVGIMRDQFEDVFFGNVIPKISNAFQWLGGVVDSVVKNIKAALIGLGVALGAMWAAVKVDEFGAKVLRIEEMFKNTTTKMGEDADSLDARINSALGGTLARYQRQQAATLGMLRGMSADFIAETARTANIVSRIMGVTTAEGIKEVFDKLIKGEVAGFTRAFVQAGLITVRESAKMQEMMRLFPVTGLEVIHAQMAEKAENYAERFGITSDALESVQKFKAAWTDMTATLAKATPVVLEPVITGLAKLMRDFSQQVTDFAKHWGTESWKAQAEGFKEYQKGGGKLQFYDWRSEIFDVEQEAKRTAEAAKKKESYQRLEAEGKAFEAFAVQPGPSAAEKNLAIINEYTAKTKQLYTSLFEAEAHLKQVIMDSNNERDRTLAILGKEYTFPADIARESIIALDKEWEANKRVLDIKVAQQQKDVDRMKAEEAAADKSKLAGGAPFTIQQMTEATRNLQKAEKDRASAYFEYQGKIEAARIRELAATIEHNREQARTLLQQQGELAALGGSSAAAAQLSAARVRLTSEYIHSNAEVKKSTDQLAEEKIKLEELNETIKSLSIRGKLAPTVGAEIYAAELKHSEDMLKTENSLRIEREQFVAAQQEVNKLMKDPETAMSAQLELWMKVVEEIKKTISNLNLESTVNNRILNITKERVNLERLLSLREQERANAAIVAETLTAKGLSYDAMKIQQGNQILAIDDEIARDRLKINQLQAQGDLLDTKELSYYQASLRGKLQKKDAQIALNAELEKQQRIDTQINYYEKLSSMNVINSIQYYFALSDRLEKQIAQFSKWGIKDEQLVKLRDLLNLENKITSGTATISESFVYGLEKWSAAQGNVNKQLADFTNTTLDSFISASTDALEDFTKASDAFKSFGENLAKLLIKTGQVMLFQQAIKALAETDWAKSMASSGGPDIAKMLSGSGTSIATAATAAATTITTASTELSSQFLGAIEAFSIEIPLAGDLFVTPVMGAIEAFSIQIPLAGQMWSTEVISGATAAAAILSSSSIGMMFAAEGGIFPGHFTPIKRFQSGGVESRPTVGMVGEAGPEAIVPLSGGRSIPVTLSGGGNGKAPNVVINLQNKTGEDVNMKQTGSSFDGETLVVNAIMTNINKNGVLYQMFNKNRRNS